MRAPARGDAPAAAAPSLMLTLPRALRADETRCRHADMRPPMLPFKTLVTFMRYYGTRCYAYAVIAARSQPIRAFELPNRYAYQIAQQRLRSSMPAAPLAARCPQRRQRRLMFAGALNMSAAANIRHTVRCLTHAVMRSRFSQREAPAAP